MFHPSPQHVFLTQQVITLNQSYPCPRCTQGMMEPFGMTETFHCTSCKRAFVPLKGGRYLYPAKSIGWRIAPTYWWDGMRWHWAGTTASAGQLAVIVLLSLLPVAGVDAAVFLHLWNTRPDWCNPAILTPLVGLLTIQCIYLLCWDFDFHTGKEGHTQI